VVVDVSGVGYRVAVPVSVLERLPTAPTESVTLIIHTQVREDDISLFGFLEEMDLQVFELLLTVSGVGPKVALAMLSAMTAEDLARAVGSGDTRTLTRVPGVGARTAQRIALELKEKFSALGFERKVEAIAARQDVKKKDAMQETVDDVVSALLNLGYNKAEAQRATEMALDEKRKGGSDPIFPELLRAALNRLTKAV